MKKLLKDSITLEALEISGVDNWHFWGEHWSMYYEESDLENFDCEDPCDCLDADVEERLKGYEVIL